jgi:hypothetical protein
MASTAETGDSTVTNYELQWDDNTGGVTWTSLTGSSSDYTGTSFTVTSGVTSGLDYQFQVRAANVYGDGTYSNIVTITAS